MVQLHVITLEGKKKTYLHAINPMAMPTATTTTTPRIAPTIAPTGDPIEVNN